MRSCKILVMDFSKHQHSCSVSLVILFLAAVEEGCYIFHCALNALARDALDRKILRYKVRPKVHKLAGCTGLIVTFLLLCHMCPETGPHRAGPELSLKPIMGGVLFR